MYQPCYAADTQIIHAENMKRKDSVDGSLTQKFKTD